MNRENLYQVFYEQQKDFNNFKENIIDRDAAKNINNLLSLKIPIIITGVRRCGKSFLLKIIQKKSNLQKKDFFYLNFNDERLVNFSIEDFQKIIDFLDENDYKNKCLLLLDEIQEADHWEKWIDRIKNKYCIIITGSNSKLLSSEISTTLTGRSISINLFPFNLKEFLAAKNIKTTDWKLDLQIQAKIRKSFNDYLKFGGFPQAVISNQKIILSELYENILYRDIVRRFNKNRTKQIKEISLYLLSNIGSDLSFRNLAKMIGIKNLITAKEMVNSFENSFLFFTINKFSYSVKTQIQNPKKIYSVDVGLPSVIGFNFSQNQGASLENLVAIELKRRNQEIYYYKEKKECDFLIKEKLKIANAIQVCYNLNDKNKEREIGGLVEAMSEYKLKEGLVLTYDQDNEFNINGKKIIVKPVWKWILE